MMVTVRAGTIAAAIVFLAVVAGCSREQQDWRSAESADSIEAYGLFIEQHPDSELATQAHTRISQLGEDRDWQATASADTADAYRQFLSQHPNGKWTQEARIRIENFALGAAPSEGATVAPAQDSPRPAAVAAQVKPAPVPPPVSMPQGGSGDYGIQLGAFSSQDKANAEWRLLAARFTAQLQGLVPRVVAVTTSAGSLFRLQATVSDEAQSRGICDALKKQAQGCVPVIPH